ncbi:hypothetical protein MUB24_05390 [Lederbergia sp. NSJ-179]|uniref:hypothetical protein n=1 Tax=Lederbergia sp. NSJ-179 TaxID=2931402 RepID=UPI001FD165CA|nr:hypothetical protein [Lederbergia sp. NSJ-179]MCJ7840358.1 hypothetical protein [Lederbergia sp. NSJ-179]
MRTISLFLIIGFIIVCFFLHILALLQLVPIYITSPLLFIGLIGLVSRMNGRNKFRGFH